MILRIFYSFHKNNYRFRVQRDSISFNSLIHEYHYNFQIIMQRNLDIYKKK